MARKIVCPGCHRQTHRESLADGVAYCSECGTVFIPRRGQKAARAARRRVREAAREGIVARLIPLGSEVGYRDAARGTGVLEMSWPHVYMALWRRLLLILIGSITMALGVAGFAVAFRLQVPWHLVGLALALGLIVTLTGAYFLRTAITKDRWKLEVSRGNMRLFRSRRSDDESLNVDISAGARVRIRRSEDSVPTSNGGRVWFSVFQVLMVAGGREFQMARFGTDGSVWLALHIEQCLRKVLPPPADSPSRRAVDAEAAHAVGATPGNVDETDSAAEPDESAEGANEKPEENEA